MNRPGSILLGLIVACGCRAKSPVRAPGASEQLGATGAPATGAVPAVTGAATAAEAAGVPTVATSPTTASELVLPDSSTPLDIAALPTRAAVAVLVRQADGAARVILWTAGRDSSSLVADLPRDFAARAIASHPAGTSLFVAGMRSGQSQVLMLAPDGATWRSTVVFATARPVERLIVGPRPFVTADGTRWRLFFSARMPGGDFSLRSVTETGKVEYQVVGPRSGADTLPDVDEQPQGVLAPSGIPMAIHPRGEPLLWQDRRGCAHLLTYDYRNWSTDRVLAAVPCGGWVSITPNGAAYLRWRGGTPGVAVIRDDGRDAVHAASEVTFLSAPVSVPDGRGVIGIVSKGGSRTALHYAPIAVPLADVANAWQLAGNACDERLFEANAGLFRDRITDQLYDLYESYAYGTAFPPPFLVTTDLLWENFGAAFNGVFILLERRHAVPAFWAFVDAANAALDGTARGTRIAGAFAALSAMRRGALSGEAGLIAHGTAAARSAVTDSLFDFAELRPRGHYTTSPAMQGYFRAVRYLTNVSRVVDLAPLASLPASVQRRALVWIDVYRPFTAPTRARLIWQTALAPPVAAYARHPWDRATVFPLGWGIDNEVLESTVFHLNWPAKEQIVSADGVRRLIPSGLDVAAMFGSSLARSLLRGDLATYPQLGPVLDSIAARRPTRTDSSSLYERWMDALAVEWADSSAIPGTSRAAPVWPAKRLQTGLASWATLREATILVTERPSAAEAGESGFEELVPDRTRGYVEPAPRTFEAIAGLYDALARSVSATSELDSARSVARWNDEPLRQGILNRLAESAREARRFAQMAESELRGAALSDSDYDAIRRVGGSAEHQFLLYKSLAEKDLALSVPDPLPRIADVAGNPQPLGVLEVAVGGPMEWHQIVPYFGRRQIVIGSIYSYYEFISHELYDNERWRKEVGAHLHPPWIQQLVAPPGASCHPAASR